MPFRWVAVMLLAAPAAMGAPLQVTFDGSVSGYGGIRPDDLTPRVAFPIGSGVTGTLVFDSAFVIGFVYVPPPGCEFRCPGPAPLPASGTVQAGGTTYSAIDVERRGVETRNGQSYTELNIRLFGPSVPPSDLDYAPGTVSLALGLSYPDPLGTGFLAYPDTALAFGFTRLDGMAFYSNVASLTLTSGEVQLQAQSVPEPGSVALLATGLLAVGLWRRSAEQHS